MRTDGKEDFAVRPLISCKEHTIINADEKNIGLEGRTMEYYTAYEKRYRAAYDADIELWGNSEKDVILAETIKKWVEDNGLKENE